jgi:hypothetical protein
VTYQKGKPVDPAALLKGMDQAGFGIAEMRVVARGIYTDEGGKPALKVSGTGQLFRLQQSELAAKLKTLGKEATITGKVEFKANQAPYPLILETVE